jgi:hypothetical protein
MPISLPFGLKIITESEREADLRYRKREQGINNLGAYREGVSRERTMLLMDTVPVLRYIEGKRYRLETQDNIDPIEQAELDMLKAMIVEAQITWGISFGGGMEGLRIGAEINYNPDSKLYEVMNGGQLLNQSLVRVVSSAIFYKANEVFIANAIVAPINE